MNDATQQIESTDNRWIDGKYAFKLEKPLTSFGEPLTHLVIREPKGGDIAKAGNPVTIMVGAEPPWKFDDSKAAAMLERLAAVTPATIAQLSPRDFVTLCYIIGPFFVPAIF